MLQLTHRAGFSARRFDPRALFRAGDLGGCWDPADLSTVFQDSAGTIPGAVDSPVGRLADKSGNGNHLTQSTDAARPVLRQSGGRYYLEFDGIDDHLRTGPMDLSAKTSMTIGVGVRVTGTTPMYVFALQAETTTTGQPHIQMFNQTVSTVRYHLTGLVNSTSTKISRGGFAMPSGTDYVNVNEYDPAGVTGYQAIPSLVGITKNGAVNNETTFSVDSALPMDFSAFGNASYITLGGVYSAGNLALPANMRYDGGLMITRKLTLAERWGLTRWLAHKQGRAL